MRILIACMLVCLKLFSSECGCDCSYFTPPGVCELCPNWCEAIEWKVGLFLWELEGDELDFATKKVTKANGKSKEKVLDVSPDFTGGYRVGFLFKSPDIDWDIGFSWTHYSFVKSSHHKVRGASAKTVAISIPLAGQYSTQLFDGDIALLKGGMKFRYEIYDLDFGTWIQPCSFLPQFRPYIGVRVADIHDIFKTRGDFAGTPSVLNVRSHCKNEMRGIGMRAGFDARYAICNGFSLLGGFSGSLLFSNVSTRDHFDQTSVNEELEESVIITKARENFTEMRPMTDLALGLEWKFYCCECYPVTLLFSWEAHTLFNQHKFYLDNAARTPAAATDSWKKDGTIVLQGFVLTGSLEF